jgi:NADPH oxidase
VLALTLRRSITWLRTSGMDWLLPLDRHIYFHKMMGWAICFFSVVHTLAHVINYGNVNKIVEVTFSTFSFVSSLPT